MTKRTPEERFWARVDRRSPDECWLWTGNLGHNGYPRFWFNGKSVRGHRFAYELLIGAIPAGLTLDHLCRNPSCVNPSHLEPVTIGENVLRGDTIMAANVAKTHCPKGHPYAGANLYLYPGGGRSCRECNRQTQRAYKEKPGVKERYRQQRLLRGGHG